uniref:Uncharacterized protein n=1 Tax=Macrostomum lignano TaxID=282301 RepID=A0A1I8J8U8_9PLAT
MVKGGEEVEGGRRAGNQGADAAPSSIAARAQRESARLLPPLKVAAALRYPPPRRVRAHPVPPVARTQHPEVVCQPPAALEGVLSTAADLPHGRIEVRRLQLHRLPIGARLRLLLKRADQPQCSFLHPQGDGSTGPHQGQRPAGSRLPRSPTPTKQTATQGRATAAASSPPALQQPSASAIAAPAASA